MSSYQLNIHISIIWNNLPDIVMTDEEKDALKFEATTHALNMMRRGYREGELNGTLRDQSIRGWWRDEQSDSI